VALIRDENDERSARVDAIIADLEKTKDAARQHIQESKRTIEKTDRLLTRRKRMIRGKRRR